MGSIQLIAYKNVIKYFCRLFFITKNLLVNNKAKIYSANCIFNYSFIDNEIVLIKVRKRFWTLFNIRNLQNIPSILQT